MKPNSMHNMRNIFDGNILLINIYIEVNNEERKKYTDS